ncbi:MAG: ATP-binding cassette domain-containing protein [Acidobacteriota bacterium]|nr:ATP-binding cassette domain-containing protein [Acidobacteriota bacterium]
MTQRAIFVSDFCKDYGDFRAVDGIGFEVAEGEIFGMVGPNGAGKTTTIECLEGLRTSDGGTIRILGLDPQARHSIWDLVRDIRKRGKTVFLTTHFMEEAEQLCDRVLVIDRGRIVALDTPENLVQNLGGETRVIFTVEDGADPGILEQLPGVSGVEMSGGRIVVRGRGDRLVCSVVNALDGRGVKFRNLRTEHPNLEDVFLAMTGDRMRE